MDTTMESRDSTKEYERVWSKIRSEIKRINGGEKVFSLANNY